VRLVDDEARDREIAGQPHKLIGREPFGRDVEQPQRASPRGVQDLAARLGRQHRMQRRRGDAAPVQLVHLVAEGLAGSRRHDRQHVAAAEDGAHDLFLAGPECLVPEVRAHPRHYFGRRLAHRAHRRRRWHRREPDSRWQDLQRDVSLNDRALRLEGRRTG
jgi:hypothetical protein